jgi:hypothetical protein
MSRISRREVKDREENGHHTQDDRNQ